MTAILMIVIPGAGGRYAVGGFGTAGDVPAGGVPAGAGAPPGLAGRGGGRGGPGGKRGQDASGQDGSGHDASGQDGSGRDASDHDASGQDGSGRDASDHDASDHDASGQGGSGQGGRRQGRHSQSSRHQGSPGHGEQRRGGQGGSEPGRPGPWEVMVLSHASGPDGRCPGLDDGQVVGVLGRWAAVDCWVAGRKLAVARELIRRRPDEDSPGTATPSGLPWEWDDRLAREVALELRASVPAARKLLQAAWALEARLPRIGQALDEGRIDLSRARMITEETGVLLDPETLARAEGLIMAGLGRCRTWTQLLRLVQRAVVTADPDGAARRREKEERENARVSFWREAAGTSALLGTGLPTDEALQAHAHVDHRAQAYRAAGVNRPIDIL
ncbi:MAG TPA: DUF222 domain-containing protein, partial [Trebonia sp.]|nr:DUF222 domain-containing protein [Trebonia sp.]